MVFWIGLLVGALFVWIAVRCGFYETWILLFNIIVSIYLAIFLRSFIKDVIPDIAFDDSYSDALIILVTSVAAFLILYGISYVFFSSQFKVNVPPLFDVVGSGILGFLSGLLLWGFISFLICITPLSNNSIMQQIGFNPKFQNNFSYMSWWVDRVNNLVSSKRNFMSTDNVINEMLTTAKKRAEEKKARPVIKPASAVQKPVRTTNEPNQITCSEIASQNTLYKDINEPNK